MSDTNSNKRIVKNTAFLYVRMILVLLVSLFTVRVVLNALGVEDYGIYNVVSGFVSMFSFLSTSISNGVQRFYNYTLGTEGEKGIRQVYTTAIQIQLLLGLLVLVLLESIGLWYIYNKMVIPVDRFDEALLVFHFSVLSMFFLFIQIPYSAAIMAFERMDFFAYVSLFDVFSKLLVSYLIYVVDSDKLMWYGVFQLMISVLTFAIYYFYAKTHFKTLKYNHSFAQKGFFSMLTFSGWNIFGSFAYMIKGQGLNMLLNVFFGPIINAARGVSNMIMSAVQGFQANIVIAFRPQIVQAYAQGNYVRVTKLFYALSKISFVMLVILSLPIMLELHYILNLWLGGTIPEYTYSFTILVLFNMVISSLNTPVSQVVHATGQMKTFQIITSLVVCSILPISWIFLKLGFNPNSVYIVSLVISVINQIVCNLVLKRIFSYNLMEYLKTTILPCLLFLILAPIIPLLPLLLMSESFLRLILVGLISVISSCSIAYWVILEQSEKELLKSFIRRKVNG